MGRTDTRPRPGAAIALLLSGCTTFYGLEPEPGTTSSSGTGGAGGSVLFKPTSLLPIFDAAHLCSLVATCPTLGDSILASTALPVVIPLASDARNFSSCVEWLTAPLAPDMGAAPRPGFAELRSMIVCMAATTTCADAGRCAFYEAIEATDARCTGMPAPRCESNTAIDCSALRVSHCKTKGYPPGSECMVGIDGSSACAVGSCTEADVSCDPSSDPGPTESSYVFRCEAAAQLRKGTNCRAVGDTCNDSAPSLPDRGCFSSMGHAKCTTFGDASCFGDRVRVCSGGLLGEVDCGGFGRTCVDEGFTARCAPANPACSPFDANVNQCDADGHTIHLCVDGKPADFDCASIGRVCAPAVGPVSGRCE